MPEDEKTQRSGAAEEEAKGSRKPARRTKAKAEEKPKGRARKPAGSKGKSEKAPAAKRAAKPKTEAKPKAKPAEKTAPAAPIVRASARYVRTAPRKARLVADQVRGLQIDRARALLQFSPRSAARDIAKLIDSAASNAENNHDLVAD